MSSDLTPAEMDDKYDNFKISEQAQRFVDLINENALNHNSEFSSQVLSDNLKRFEFDQGSARTGAANKTTSLMGVVSQTVYENALMQDDGDYKLESDMTESDIQKKQDADSDMKAIAKAVYDDPIANPLRRDLGGHFDIEQAQIDLTQGVVLKPSVFTEGIPTSGQEQILEAIAELPIHIQQNAAQGLKQAAQDAKHNKRFGGLKTASIPYVRSVINDQLTGFDNHERSNGRDAHANSYSDMFDNAIINAKARQNFANKLTNPDLASNKPPVLIGADFNDPFAKMMVNGINKDIEQIHKQSQDPHTVKGDKQMSYEIEQVLDNTIDLSKHLDKSIQHPNRDKSEDYEVVGAFRDMKSVADNLLELSSEMAARNYPLEISAREAKQTIEDYSPSGDFTMRASNAHTETLLAANRAVEAITERQSEPVVNSPSMRP